MTLRDTCTVIAVIVRVRAKVNKEPATLMKTTGVELSYAHSCCLSDKTAKKANK
jgi:hypothetical protein